MTEYESTGKKLPQYVAALAGMNRSHFIFFWRISPQKYFFYSNGCSYCGWYDSWLDIAHRTPSSRFKREW